MRAALLLAADFASAWAAIYTLGLPEELRQARRSEIDSDLWEQQCLAARRGDPQLGTAIEVLARTLLGAISDITWRAQAGASARADRSLQMNEALYMRGLVGVGVALGLLVVVASVGAMFNAWEDGDSEGWLVFGGLSALSGVAMMAGLLISRRSPALGIGLVAVGAIAIAVIWYWLLVITIPIGIGLVAIAYFRGRGARDWPRGAGMA